MANSDLISASLDENILYLRKQFSDSMDLIIRRMKIGENEVAFVICEGMCNTLMLSTGIIEPLVECKFMPSGSNEQFEYIRDNVLTNVDVTQLCNMDDVTYRIMSGFVLILVDGVASGLVCGVQGFIMRSPSEPTTEVMEHGSKEGFVENLRGNISLVRKRMKNTQLCFESMKVGDKSNTEISLCYLKDCVKPELLNEIRKRIRKIKIDAVLDSTFLKTFLNSNRFSVFTGVGITERPDVLCGKLIEGRIGIMVDGTPYVLLVPYLFAENFQEFDDYCYRPYYATFLRWLKYLSFFITMFLPGLYVAIGSFHQELFPSTMLFNIVAVRQRMPLPLLLEALIIHISYEIMREAGLRLPKPMGHAVSIIGGLVIGDAAVSAGLVGGPMLIIVAITAISSFVVPKLYESVAVLRLIFIIVGGTFGIYGLTIGFILVIANIALINPYKIPYSAPFSPFDFKSMRDVLVRASWRYLNNKTMNVSEYEENNIK